MKKWCLLFFIGLISSTYAQSVLFDFDNAPLYTSLPINQTAGGITAHLSATGEGYSIQNANVLGFTPQGFSGHVIYPNSIFLADLLISFDQTLTHFSIMYSSQELGCDDAATMRATAYMNGFYVGTNTKTASNPGTWPTDTLSYILAQGFDSVVIHYDSPPPTCQDYGVIYMADNMQVSVSNATAISEPQTVIKGLNITNPFSQSAIISFSLRQDADINIVLYDLTGRLVKHLFNGHLTAGEHKIKVDLNDEEIMSGLYFLKLTGENRSLSCKLDIIK